MRQGLVLILALWISPTSLAAFPPAPSDRPSALMGEIVDAQGRPVAGARVYETSLVSGPGVNREAVDSVETDRRGHFQFHSNGGWRTSVLIVAPPAGSPGAITFAPVRRAARIHLESPTTLRLVFLNSAGEPLAGRMVALLPAADDKPLDGSVSDLQSPNYAPELAPRLTGRTDIHGVLTVPDLPQNGAVSVTIQASETYPTPLVLNGSVSLKPGPLTEAAPIRVALNGVITGRVYIRRTGAPVAGARVILEGPGYHNTVTGVVTDGDGRYQIDDLFPAGFYVMMQDSRIIGNGDVQKYLPLARTRSGQWLPPFEYAAVKIASGEKATGIDFTLVRTAAINVRVLDRKGRPVAAAPVSVEGPGGGGQGRSTDSNGACRFQVEPGAVRVSQEGYPGAPFGSLSRLVTVAEGSTVTVTLNRSIHPKG